MTRRLVFSLLLLGVVGACLPGPEDLEERSNAEIIVTGVDRPMRLSLRIGDLRRTTEPTGEDDVVVFHLMLEHGTHDGLIRVRRDLGESDEVCARFTLEIDDDGDTDATAVDVRTLDSEACEDHEDEDPAEGEGEGEEPGEGEGEEPGEGEGEEPGEGEGEGEGE